MNYFEEEIIKLNRRIERIEKQPDTTKLKTNKMLYECERELNEQQLNVWKEGRPFLFAMPPPCSALARALGLEPLNMHHAADRAKDPMKYFDIVREHGYPDHHCDRTIVGVGMAMAGNLPVPSLILSDNASCDPIMFMASAIGYHFSVPTFLLDVDYVVEEPNEEFLHYTTQQIEEFIEFAQKQVPGVKFDMDKLIELHEMDRSAGQYLREISEFRKAVPCPMRGQDVFRLPRPPSLYPHPAKVIDYLRMSRDEVGEKVAKGIGAVEEEKLRVMWALTAPYFADVFQILEKRGASVVHFQVGYAARHFGVRGHFGDEVEYGRKLTPLEEQARVATFNSWGGLGKRWADDTAAFCRSHKIDAIINFEQWGCVAAALVRKILEDRIEKELGVKILSFEGRNIDRAAFDEKQLTEKLEIFVDTCISAKA